MPNCVVKGCKNHSSKNKKQDGITFHTFPIRNNDKWVQAMRVNRNEPSWNPTVRSVVCSAHFDNEDLYTTNKGFRRVLRKGYPKHLPAAPDQSTIYTAPGPSAAVTNAYTPVTQTTHSISSVCGQSYVQYFYIREELPTNTHTNSVKVDDNDDRDDDDDDKTLLEIKTENEYEEMTLDQSVGQSTTTSTEQITIKVEPADSEDSESEPDTPKTQQLKNQPADQKTSLRIKTEKEYEEISLDQSVGPSTTSSTALQPLQIPVKLEPPDSGEAEPEPDTPKTLQLKNRLKEKSLIIEKQTEEIKMLQEEVNRLRTRNKYLEECLKKNETTNR